MSEEEKGIEVNQIDSLEHIERKIGDKIAEVEEEKAEEAAEEDDIIVEREEA